jgi:hypothetical protein
VGSAAATTASIGSPEAGSPSPRPRSIIGPAGRAILSGIPTCWSRTPPLAPIGLEERAQVEVVDDVQDEPGQVVGWQPVADIGWEQERLVAVTGTEVAGQWPILRHQLALLPDPAAVPATGCYEIESVRRTRASIHRPGKFNRVLLASHAPLLPQVTQLLDAANGLPQGFA